MASALIKRAFYICPRLSHRLFVGNSLLNSWFTDALAGRMTFVRLVWMSVLLAPVWMWFYRVRDVSHDGPPYPIGLRRLIGGD